MSVFTLTQCHFFCFFMLFNVNLLFVNVYTPPKLLSIPPSLKFLEITLKVNHH